jgi:hypothetical protein
VFWRIWLLHRDVHECRNSDEQNDASECDQGNWQCLQHCLLCIISFGELVEEELMKDHLVEGEVELMNDKNRAVCDSEFWMMVGNCISEVIFK